MSTLVDTPAANAADIRAAMEFYAGQGWTDGLPVVPVTESYLAEFLARTGRDPDDTLFTMPHLNRTLTVRLAAINAAMAGCLPDYFPVVLAGWDALTKEPYPVKGIWQSTTGTAPLLLINGPIRQEIELNCKGNVFGSGFRANATIGRAIRLTAINVFGLRPHQLDQATQATLGKYSACIGENQEESPWEPFHAEHGLDPETSAVTAYTIRSCIHIEARHTRIPEQLALDLAGTLRRTGALIHETNGGLIVLGPEHAHVFADAGWTKADLRRFLYEHAVNTRAELAAVGKDAISRLTRWRVPADHPDAIPDAASATDTPDRVPAITSPEAINVVVAGANNAGVSTIIETFGPRGNAPSIAPVRDR